MSKYIFFLGHQPHLSLAELEAVFGANSIQAIEDQYAILELAKEPNIDQLGGTTKISKVIKTTNLEDNLENQLQNLLKEQLAEQKTNKLKLGISIYSGKNNTQLSRKFIQKTLEELREATKSSQPDLNLHTIDSKSSELSTAQIIHSGLLKKGGLSLDIIIESRHPDSPAGGEGSSQRIILCETIQVPNLKRYTLRDYGKPKPSGVNGMLPPKLAQILINLSRAKTGDHILDPFCGSGTILQEAMLLGIDCTGTDLNPQIIEDAQENLAWLDKRFRLRGSKVKFNLEVADATSHQWSEDITHIICETYLGTPLSREPSSKKLQEIVEECNKVSEGFLKNLATQLKKDQRLVVALPCWFVDGNIIKLPVVENLSALGYNLLKSKKRSAESQSDLVYHRKNQIVGRDIYILSKK